ncbi:hypothetical protein [Kitasatospora sp. NPDC001683]
MSITGRHPANPYWTRAGPFRDLLEDLLAGIHGCRLLHDEYTEPDDQDDEETVERHQHHSRAQFAATVRTTAAQNRDRLMQQSPAPDPPTEHAPLTPAPCRHSPPAPGNSPGNSR